MDYFIISQDQRISHSIEPVGVSKLITKDMLKKSNIRKLDKLPIMFEIKSGSSEYIDFIENPVTLVSDKLKAILEKYDDRIFFKPVFLADLKQTKNDLYWLMVPDSKDCLSPKSEFNKNGTVKKLIIDEKKAAYFKVFKVSGIMENFIVVRLDVAESMLRRGFRGIGLKRLDKE